MDQRTDLQSLMALPVEAARVADPMWSQWQPIETAPKDGTRIIVFRMGRVYVADWMPYWKTWGVSAERVPGQGEAFTDIGQIVFGSQLLVDGPSHWMPLPEPPTP